MEARYETHRLIKELQREKRLETQAKQEQAVPVTQDVRSKQSKTKGLPVTVPQAVSAEEVTAQAAKFKRWQRLSCCWKSRQS